jgi:phage gp36-like protein
VAYSSAAALSLKFGSANIKQWSDLAGAGVVDADRVAVALAWADAQIDSILTGGPYSLPLIVADSSTALAVQEWSVVLACHWLYFSRGLLDKDEQGEKMTALRENVEKEIWAVSNGKRRLAARRRWAPNPSGATAG